MNHIPVLLTEVITALHPEPNGMYIDATLGDAGHTLALLEHSSPNGRVLGLDQDEKQIEIARARLNPYQNRCQLICARFSHLKEVAMSHDVKEVDGILFDLGISSRQLSDSRYGLDFQDETPLDMRLSQSLKYSAADVLNHANETELADMLYFYGDRHNSRTLARHIIQYRRKKIFRVAYDLKSALNLWSPHVLAPIFQALRIRVNEEYEELTLALPQAISLLKLGGILCIITFHSGEDRIVKRLLNQNRELLKVSKKIITPRYEEIRTNPRARSAKMRVAIRI